MRIVVAIAALGFLHINPAWTGANCQHSNSWQCAGSQSSSSQMSQTGSGIATGGHTPDPGITNNHLGTGSTGGSQPALTLVPAMQVPPQPPAQQTPQPVPVQVPPKIVQKVPQPQTAAPSNLVSLLVAPHPSLVHKPAISSTRPTTQVTGPGQAGKRPPVTDRPVTQVGTGSRPRPVLTAHKPASVTSTSPHVVSVPGRVPPQITGPKQPVQPSHVVQPQSHSAALPSGLSGELWSQEVIEPGIQNQRVELYRSNDAEEVLYKDVIPMDKTGFHLTVFGTRPPAYQ